MPQFSPVDDIKDNLEDAEAQRKSIAGSLILTTCATSFFVRRAIHQRLEDNPYVKPGIEQGFASVAATTALSMGLWGAGKLITTGTSDGVKAGAAVGIIASLVGVGVGEVVAWLFSKNSPDVEPGPMGPRAG